MKKSLIIIALFILFVNNYLAGSELEISYDDTDFYQQLFGIFTRYNPDSLWLASFPISAEECLLELDILKEKQLTEKELYVIDNLREKVQFYNNNKGLRLNYFGYLESEYHDLKNSCFEYINQDEINYSYHTWLDLEGFFTPIPDLKIYGKVRLGLVDSFTVSYLRSWFDYMYGTLESGYLHYSKGGFEILFGRQTPRIGPLFSEGLLLSGETAPYNLIKLKYKTGRFYLQYFTAKLDNYRAEPDSLLHKYISSHRVGFKYKGLEVGMTELALYARESTPE
ncbi:hypothetical protein JXI42_13555, partial [bacterium]|nr:hypothetical protein [bacterium]